MEQIYAFGVPFIEFVQYWFEDNANYFEIVNHVFNPHNAIEILFPLVSIIDSVFAAQLLLCLAFGGWLNAVMKWWLLEDRPYWWIRETTFYSDSHRPVLQQTTQTCETGPGSPSGHSMTAAMLLVLSLMWISHVCNDRKFYIWWWRYLLYPLFAAALISVMLARLYVAAHFPHQCLIGALIGAFLAPALCIYITDPFIWKYGYHLIPLIIYTCRRMKRAEHTPLIKKITLYKYGRGWCSVTSAFLAPALCIYITDPFIWKYGYHATYDTSRAVACHVLSTLVTAVIAGLTYWSLKLCGWDPQWTIKLAFRWCENPESIQVTTTPMYALVVSTGCLLGWALCVTPAVAEYRHYTKNRSLIISLFSTALILMGYHHIQNEMCKSDVYRYYAFQFILAAVKPLLLLRMTPALAMWPFTPAKAKSE